VVASIVPLSSFPVTPPLLEEHSSISLKKIYNASKSGFIGCFISGIFISAIFSMLPLYIEEIADNTNHIAMAMAITFLAGVSIQYPLGSLSDKMDRQKIQIMLNVVYSILLLIFAGLQYYKFVDYNVLLLIVTVIGMFSFTIYPISMNLVCDNLKRSEIIRGTEGLTIAFGVGSIVGPIYVSLAIKIFGFYGYPISYSILTIFLAIFTFMCFDKSKNEKQMPVEEITTPFVPYSQINLSTISSNLESNDNKVD
jgi:MFS family permease